MHRTHTVCIVVRHCSLIFKLQDTTVGLLSKTFYRGMISLYTVTVLRMQNVVNLNVGIFSSLFYNSRLTYFWIIPLCKLEINLRIGYVVHMGSWLMNAALPLLAAVHAGISHREHVRTFNTFSG